MLQKPIYLFFGTIEPDEPMAVVWYGIDGLPPNGLPITCAASKITTTFQPQLTLKKRRSCGRKAASGAWAGWAAALIYGWNGQRTITLSVMQWHALACGCVAVTICLTKPRQHAMPVECNGPDSFSLPVMRWHELAFECVGEA